MAGFFNQNEQGIEGVAGVAGTVVKTTVKAVSDQVGTTAGDFFKQLLGDLGSADQDMESGTEAMGQMSGKGRAGLKSKKNVHNPSSQQAALMRHQKFFKEGKTPEDIERLEKLRKILHDEQVRDILEPKKKQQEESVAEKNEREEQEKKQKAQVKQQEEVKKKEDLSVVQKRTGIENKGWGAG